MADAPFEQVNVGCPLLEPGTLKLLPTARPVEPLTQKVVLSGAGFGHTYWPVPMAVEHV